MNTTTSIVDIVTLICVVTMHNYLIYLASYQFVNTPYVNALLKTLNARESMASRGAVTTTNRLSDIIAFADFGTHRSSLLHSRVGGQEPCVAVVKAQFNCSCCHS